MGVNQLVALIFFVCVASCSKKSGTKTPNRSSADQISEEETSISIEEESQDKKEVEIEKEKAPKIIDITLENLVDNQMNQLAANTNIGTVKAVYSGNTTSDLDVEFKILETAETDYEQFEISGSTISNKEALVGNKRFILNISAQSGETSFETSIIFSVSAGDLPPETPQNLLFQSNTSIGEDNIVGSFFVVDDERFDHIISFVESEAAGESENDNSLFSIVEDKLYTSDTFAWKESFTIKVEAKNSAYEELKFATEITFSIAQPIEETEFVYTTVALDPARYPADINDYPCNTKVLNAWPTDSSTYIFNDDCAVNPWKCALTDLPFDSVTTGLIGVVKGGDCPTHCKDNLNCNIALGDNSGDTCYLHSDMSMWPIQHELYDLVAVPYERFSLTRICR